MRRRVRVLLFNVKGEDLLFLDEPNRTYAAKADRADLDDRWRRLGLDGRRRLPRRRLLGPAAPRRPPPAELRVAPRGRAGLRLDAPRVRAAGPAALLLLGRVGHAQPAELRRGARARRAAAARGAGDRPPRRASGLMGGPVEGAPAQRAARPGERADGRALPRPRRPGGVAGRRAGRRRGRRRRLDRPGGLGHDRRLRAPPGERGGAPARPGAVGRLADPARRRRRGRAAGRGGAPGPPARLRPALRGRHPAGADLQRQGGRDARPDRVRGARRAQQVRARARATRRSRTP